MREARLLLAAGMLSTLKGALSFAVRARLVTVVPRASTRTLASVRCAGLAAPTAVTKPRPASVDYRVLEELASRVVHGTTDKESLFPLAWLRFGRCIMGDCSACHLTSAMRGLHWCSRQTAMNKQSPMRLKCVGTGQGPQ